MKTLFYFQGQETSIEVFAETEEEAIHTANLIMNKERDSLPLRLKFVTQNHSCPKCSCQATECNFS